MAISGLYGTASYAYKGRVELLAAIIMLCGAAIGAQIGVVATQVCQGLRHPHRVRSGRARRLMSVVLKLLQAEFPAWAWLFSPLATVEVLGFVSAISIYITIRMVQGAKAELAAKKQQAVGN